MVTGHVQDGWMSELARHPDPADPLPWLRAICLSLPEATEKLSHGSPSFVANAGMMVWNGRLPGA